MNKIKNKKIITVIAILIGFMTLAVILKFDYLLRNQDKKDDKVSVNNIENKVLKISRVKGNTASYNAVAEFDVSLLSKPDSDVVIPVSSSDEKEGVITVSELVFTPGMWRRREGVVVKGRNRNVMNGTQNYKIILGPIKSLDKKYDGKKIEVSMKGIVLNLNQPVDSTKFFTGLSKTIEVDTEYTGNRSLVYTLMKKPKGMVIDREIGSITWTPSELAEGKTFPVKVKVIDGKLFSEISFNVSVAKTSTLITQVGDRNGSLGVESGKVQKISFEKEVKNNVLIVQGNNPLKGLTFERLSGKSLKSVKLKIITENEAPIIPYHITKLTDIFSITPGINGDVKIKLPKDLIPEGRSLFELRLFRYNITAKDTEKGFWNSVSVGFDLEGDSDDPVVIVQPNSIGGLYFIGIEKKNKSNTIQGNLKTQVKNNVITITDKSSNLNGLIIKTDESNGASKIKIKKIDDNDLNKMTVIPNYVTRVSDAFIVKVKYSGNVKIKLPMANIPSWTDLNYVRLYSLVTADGRDGEFWSTVSIRTDIDDDGVEVSLTGLEGVFFIGIEESETLEKT